MSRVLAAVLTCAFTVVLAQQLQAAPARKAKRSGVGSPVVRHTTAKSRTAGAHLVRTSRQTVKGRRRTIVRSTGPSYQLHPDEDRYREIQKALTDRGFYKGEVNGQWSADSVDALKQFQTGQKLDADGRINSHTLIGLGLGPKHDGSTASTVPATAMTPADAPPAPENATFADPDQAPPQ